MVLRPLIISQESNGARPDPVALITKNNFLANTSLLVARTPAMTSWWPFIHHGVVKDNHTLWVLLVSVVGDSFQVTDLDEWVGWRLQEHHFGGLSDLGGDQLQVGGVVVTNLDTVDRLDIGQKSISSSVQVISGNNFIAWSQRADNDVQGSHTGVDSVHELGFHDFGKVLLQSGSSWISRPGIVKFAHIVERVWLESGRQVHRSNRCVVAILVGDMDKFCF
ncbi:hypothetical protein OGAPHI_004317 [Ogataea philodendri]|uniref:Uncharacterized protein n=1 Tax=Ogataea philodendri TaxID=1378263 RepID=A0A9P8P5C7_9ASCO|nr:uncharacterized protein OGAPHI_004317 [Ogataea philodendri]KAH3666128.1 hypothetical protein OGAPHI_004317 [Ogataea philodendri]